jgi:hypothetical protein
VRLQSMHDPLTVEREEHAKGIALLPTARAFPVSDSRSLKGTLRPPGSAERFES